jgi:indole-3-glycerol phosphate synthase
LTPPRAEIPGVLGRICTSVRQRLEATADTRTGRAFAAAVAAADPRGTAFAAALASSPGPAVIAECKRTSPSKGRLCEDYDPAAIATAYAAGGAAAISVLTEPAFFEGDLGHLHAVRHAVEIPVLRKDFMLERSQLEEARAAGADAVLLIVAALDDGTLRSLHAAASDLGLAALVEVHDERELDRAIAAGATIIGVNNRDLRSLETDPTTAERLSPRIPPEAIAVCESGLRAPEDLARFSTLGYRGFLVGETLMRSDDSAAALRRLRGEAP